MNRIDAQILLEAREWTFAKTMPHIPHFWTARRDWPKPELFTEVCQFILDNGVMEQFKTFKAKPYFYANGFRYWIMGPPDTTTVINRCDPKHPKLAPHIKAV